MEHLQRPDDRPRRPQFSSGPCAKPASWTPDSLSRAVTGRSHRSPEGKARLGQVIDLTREILGIPDEFRIGIVPGSDTGAVEMAMWSLLGQRRVEVMAWEAFGKGWLTDITTQLRLDAVTHLAPYGELPDLSRVDFAADVVFAWNGTTSGVRVPDGDFIPEEREGLTICDATSAAFAMELPWDKLDVTTFSWQKVLGGEAAHGMIVLSPRAADRLQSWVPPWPVPKIFRLTGKGAINEAIFAGSTINTPSMLCVEDCLHSLNWARSIGGLPELIARTEANAAVIAGFVGRHGWISHLAGNPAHRSTTSVCLVFDGPELADGERGRFAGAVARRLADQQVALDIGSYRDAPPGLRIWCGATVENSDLRSLMPWIEWAYHSERLAILESAGKQENGR